MRFCSDVKILKHCKTSGFTKDMEKDSMWLPKKKKNLNAIRLSKKCQLKHLFRRKKIFLSEINTL